MTNTQISLVAEIDAVSILTHSVRMESNDEWDVVMDTCHNCQTVSIDASTYLLSVTRTASAHGWRVLWAQ